MVVPNHTFTLSPSGNHFLRDGATFRVVAGSMHPWRMPPATWPRRLHQAKAMGLNTVLFYVRWSMHEPSPGKFDFNSTASHDIVAFVRAVQHAGLLAICRIGPYITAEVDFGGFPWWFSAMEPPVRFRSMDPAYLNLVSRYFDALLPRLVPLQHDRGGPIISWQISDDTDIAGMNAHPYYAHIRDALRARGVTTLISTLAGDTKASIGQSNTPLTWIGMEMGHGSKAPTRQTAATAFAEARKATEHGRNGTNATGNPNMNMELYAGWIDCEGSPHNTRSAQAFDGDVDAILNCDLLAPGDCDRSSVSIYMVHGGTNFGWSGCGNKAGHRFCAVPTSYDYDAPITEAGNMGAKYKSLRLVFSSIAKENGDPAPPAPLAASPLHLYQTLQFQEAAALSDPHVMAALETGAAVVADAPVGMEALGYGYGFVVYEYVGAANALKLTEGGPSLGYTGSLQDLGFVIVNGSLVGKLGWGESNPSGTWPTTVIMPTGENHLAGLSVIVQNKGRQAGELKDYSAARKGVWGNFTLNGETLSGWKSRRLPLTPTDITRASKAIHWSSAVDSVTAPTLWRTNIHLGSTPVQHTYLSVEGWGSGVIFVNGFNLGKFTHRGPQGSVYVPATAINSRSETGVAEVIVLETERPQGVGVDARTMRFVDHLVWLS